MNYGEKKLGLKKNNLNWSNVLYGVCLIFFFGACTEKKYELTWTEKQQIDSVYKERALLMSKEMDSICVVQHDSLVRYYYDSILNIRISELTEK